MVKSAGTVLERLSDLPEAERDAVDVGRIAELRSVDVLDALQARIFTVVGVKTVGDV